MKNGLIVAYRTSFKADGTQMSTEEDSLINVEDKMQMIAATLTTQQSLVEQHAAPEAVSSVGASTFTAKSRRHK